MNTMRFRPAAVLAAMLLALTPAIAQQDQTTSAAVAPAAKTFSQQELDQLLAPIALYPDALLAQVLMASTYPLEVVEAARWVKANPKITGKALEDAMAGQSWDPAVKSLTTVPQVLQQMNEKLDWTQKLGDAFLAQQGDVMDTVQILRGKAAAAGNLKSSEQQVVKTETQGSQTIYVVESPKPEVVYVPTYNPSVVYGTWWYPTPPYYMYPPSYVYAPGLAFATGVFVGAAIWGGCHWGWGGHGSVNVNVNRYNSFNRTNISSNNWNHSSDHRRGVSYRDQNVANKYNRGNNQASKSREDFRGRADSGRNELKGMDRNELNNKVKNADRGAGVENRMDGNRREGAGERNHAGAKDGSRFDGGGAHNAASSNFDGAKNHRANSGGGFSGAGNGAATREASSRGGASRADMGSRGGSDRAASAHRGGGGGARAGGGGGGRGRR